MNSHGRKKTRKEKDLFDAGRKAAALVKNSEVKIDQMTERVQTLTEHVDRLTASEKAAREQSKIDALKLKICLEELDQAEAQNKKLEAILQEVMQFLGVSKPQEVLPTLAKFLRQRNDYMSEARELVVTCQKLEKELYEERSKDIRAEANEKLRRENVRLARERDEAKAALERLLTEKPILRSRLSSEITVNGRR